MSTTKDQSKSKTMDLLNKLKQGIEAVKSSEDFKRYLKAMSLFHHYSFHNCLLIGLQMPKASYVNGYRKWQKLGRQVKKGEHGIAIFAPMRVKRRDEETKDEDEYITLFRVVHVFDISQTEGEELPRPPRDEIRDSHADLLQPLLKFAEAREIKVSFQNLANIEGTSMNGQVLIHEERNPTQQALILVHELAHEMIHWDPEKRPQLTKEIKELEADAVAFVVAENLGISNNSDKYLALYHKSYDLQQSLEVIHRAASDILKSIKPDDKPEKASEAA